MAEKLQKDLHAFGLDINAAKNVISSEGQAKFLPSLESVSATTHFLAVWAL